MSILCDLVLLSWNHLEETQPCLESLFRCTDVPSRLLIVDNGSAPAVRNFLKTVRPHGAIHDVILIQNETNEGFSRGMNQGMQASRAPYVCLLNNDLLFTSGWLSRVLDVAQAHPEIGMLNPVSNTFGQRPPRGTSLEAYAKSLDTRRGGYVEVGMCIGFCLLAKREVLSRIGLLTEEVDRIFFEDEDWCMRAQQAGYQCVVVSSSYVHHAEHQTVRQMPERDALFARNQRWCNHKWGRRLRVAWPRFTPVAPGSADLRLWLEQAVRMARMRTHVYVYSPTCDGRLTHDGVFRSVGLVPHADVIWRPLPSRSAAWAAACAILARQKKRFDAIIAPTEGWAVTMRQLRWLHRADVVRPSPDLERLTQQWRARSPCPSSS